MTSKQEAMRILQEARELLDQQDVSILPNAAKLRLLEAQRCIYLEIQEQQVQSITERTEEYRMVTEGLKESESGFRAIHDWAKSAEQTGEAVNGLLRGVSLILSLL